MDGGVRSISNAIYVYAAHTGKGAGDLVPCFLIYMLPLVPYQSQLTEISLLA
jgi:hypothetical protein